MEVKRELDSMLPLPLVLASRQHVQSPPISTQMETFKEKQAVLNQLIEEKKNKQKNRKKKEQKGISADNCVSPRSEALLLSEECPVSEGLSLSTEPEAVPSLDLHQPADVGSCHGGALAHNSPAAYTNMEDLTSSSNTVTEEPEESPPACSSPRIGKELLPPSRPHSVRSDQSPLLTARSQHVQAGNARTTSSGATRDAATQNTDADEDRILGEVNLVYIVCFTSATNTALCSEDFASRICTESRPTTHKTPSPTLTLVRRILELLQRQNRQQA